MKKALRNFYWWARGVITPGLVYSQEMYEKVLDEHIAEGMVWCDLGCGHQVLPSWRTEQEWKLVKRCRTVLGLDYDAKSLAHHHTISDRVRGDILRLPFADDSFDLVTMNMVVEHLSDPASQFGEVRRVLKRGGILIFHTPNAHSYFVVLRKLVPDGISKRLARILEDRPADDVFEVHYKANTRGRIRELAADSGFEVAEVRMISTDAVSWIIPPLVVAELVWIRALMTRPLSSLRTNIIAVLRKRMPEPNGRVSDGG